MNSTFQGFLGTLPARVVADIQAYLADPTDDGWDRIHNVYVSNNPLRTLWQAVCRVDPTFPKQSPACRGEGKGEIRDPWPRIPDRFLIALALVASIPYSPPYVRDYPSAGGGAE